MSTISIVAFLAFIGIVVVSTVYFDSINRLVGNILTGSYLIALGVEPRQYGLPEGTRFVDGSESEDSLEGESYERPTWRWSDSKMQAYRNIEGGYSITAARNNLRPGVRLSVFHHKMSRNPLTAKENVLLSVVTNPSNPKKMTITAPATFINMEQPYQGHSDEEQSPEEQSAEEQSAEEKSAEGGENNLVFAIIDLEFGQNASYKTFWGLCRSEAKAVISLEVPFQESQRPGLGSSIVSPIDPSSMGHQDSVFSDSPFKREIIVVSTEGLTV